MADSPAKNKDRVLACSVYVNGSKLKDTFSLVSASVRLPRAEPHWQGDAEV